MVIRRWCRYAVFLISYIQYQDTLRLQTSLGRAERRGAGWSAAPPRAPPSRQALVCLPVMASPTPYIFVLTGGVDSKSYEAKSRTICVLRRLCQLQQERVRLKVRSHILSSSSSEEVSLETRAQSNPSGRFKEYRLETPGNAYPVPNKPFYKQGHRKRGK